MKLLLTAIITTLVFAASNARSDNGPQAQHPGDTLEAAELGQALTPEDMGRQTGRQGVVIDELTNTLNSTEANGTVGSNLLSLSNSATGTNIVSDNAFGATNGVATVIQNSGNQNVIQSSFILNLTVK
jgi:hypothetical protein